MTGPIQTISLHESLLARLVGFGQSRLGSVRSALILTLLIAVPLIALANRGLLVSIPFSQDYAVLARVFVALPLLVISASHFQSLISEALVQAPRAGLVSDDALQTYERWLALLNRLRSSRLVEILFVVLALASILWRNAIPGPLLGYTGWGYDPQGDLNAAGKYYVFVFLPLFRFITLLWLWRLLLWTVFLGSLSFLKLNLNPAHPDGAGGIGYLGFVQQRLSVFLVVGSFMLAGSAANRIAHLGERPEQHFYVLLGFILLYPTILLAPLLLTTPLLLQAKRDGIFRYGVIGQDMTMAFQRKWIDSSVPGDEQIESPNPSAMTDFAQVHGIVQQMGILPITRWGVASMYAAATAPLLLLIFLQVPLDTLLRSALSEVPPLDLVASAQQMAK